MQSPRFLTLCLTTLAAASSSLALTTAVPCAADEFTFGNRTIRVPAGYVVEQVTDPSLVERPIAVSRDERGRLYVTDSGGMSERAEQQLEARPHSIRRLEDTNGDGIYDRSTLFADRMMFPEGCQWFQGSLYVAAPPEIWKLTDHDDDGVAEQREVWFDGKTLTGCGNDLHGPYLGHDGWLYWCKGAFAEQTYTLPTGKPFVTRSSHIFRARPDGTGIEPVLTGGMDNPVNVAFLANGERFLSCTFFQFPEAGRRDGLIHAIYGGVYGKKHDSIFAHPMTGDVMPVLNHQGAAAPCGLIAGSESLLGGGCDRSLFACYFNLHKVVRHDLQPDGPTYTTQDQDFVACDHPDFHPTDVYEDADGSLLVVDTGGWYKVCCPTSQLAKPDVLGAVYRIRRAGTPAVTDPLGLSIAWDKATPETLTTLLSDSRLFVQRRATQQLRQLAAAAVAPLSQVLRQERRPDVRRRAVWTLAGIDDPAARAAVRAALQDRDPAIQQVAAHVAALHRDQAALPELLQLATQAEAGPARVAAEAIGRIGQADSVPAVLQLLASLPAAAPDQSGAPATSAARIREHALIYALIEIGQPQLLLEGLQSTSAQVRRGALVALDQIPNSGIQAEHVLPLLSADDPVLRATAVWIAGHHPDWGGALASFFAQRLTTSAAATSEVRAQTVELLSSLAAAAEIQELLRQQLTTPTSPAAQQLSLQALAQAGLTTTPPAWLEAMAAWLSQADPDLLPLGVSAVRQWTLPRGGHAGLTTALLHTAARQDVPTAVRLEALQAAGAGHTPDAAAFELLLQALHPEQAMGDRMAAADVLGGAALTAAQRRTLLSALKTVGPLELPRLLPVFEQELDERLGLQLVSALQESAGLRGLRTDLVKPLLAKYPPSVQTAGQPLLTALNASAEQQTAHLDQLLQDLPEGDVRRGHEVFMGKKAACITCHKLGYGGGRLGPDLSNIGRVRNRRDLLEAIVYPSVSIVRGYEPVVVELQDGRTLAGIVISESRDEIVLGLDAQKTSHIARTDIAQIVPSNLSPMPNGLATLLSAQELADLMAFLQNLK